MRCIYKYIHTYQWNWANVEILGTRTWGRRRRLNQAGYRGRCAATRAASYRRRSSAPPSGCWARRRRSVGSARPVGRRHRHRHHRPNRSTAWGAAEVTAAAAVAVRPSATRWPRLGRRQPTSADRRYRWSCIVVPRHIHLPHRHTHTQGTI